MDRFGFLKSDYEEIYKLCEEAEKNRNMNKARQVLEVIAKQFEVTRRHLFDSIGELSDKEIVPKNIIPLFHQVRIVGNKASHANEITETDIDNCLNSLFEIVVWLAIGHDKKVYKATDFNDDDLEIISKYQVSKIKSKRETIKDLGIDVNPLDIDDDDLNFDNNDVNSLDRDVFETADEYMQRISELLPHHIGYGILDKREQDLYTEFVFPMFHIEREDKISFSDVDAFIAKMDKTDDDFIDGKIIVGLKVFNSKVYCDYNRIYLQSQNGNEIKLTTICWNKYDYENDTDYKQRLKNLSTLPIGVAKPIRKEYDLEAQILPFKVALYKYVKSILNFDEVYIQVDRDNAKEFCNYQEKFLLYGKVDEILNSDNWQCILKHVNYSGEIKCNNIKYHL